MPERLSASVAAKHIACHASANLELAIPGWTPPVVDDTKASAKGTEIHTVLEDSGKYPPREQLGIAKAMQYIAELRMQRRFTQLTEAKSTGWWLLDPPKTTADVVLYVQDELHVVDYKFGKILVEALDNAQGKYYALSFAPLAPLAKGVWFHIVQPFIDNFDKVFFTSQELEQFRLETLAAEAAIAAGDVTFGPSDNCKFCPANPHGRGVKAKPYCPAMMQMLYPMTLDVNDVLQ